MKNYVTKVLLILLAFILTLGLCSSAHSGRTDSNGGHRETATGDYHYHHGYPAHYHTSGVCPYNFDDKTGSSSSSSEHGSNGQSGKRVSNTSNSFSSIGYVGAVLVGTGYVTSVVIRSKMEQRSRQEKYDQEKAHFTEMYGGKEITEIVKIPDGVYIDEDGLPYTIDDSGLRWGRYFTVYVTPSGKRYHRRKGCSSATLEAHLYNTLPIKTGCHNCVDYEIAIKEELRMTNALPDWYKECCRIRRIKDMYRID